MWFGVIREGRRITHFWFADIWETFSTIYEILIGHLKSYLGFEQVYVAVVIVVEGARMLIFNRLLPTLVFHWKRRPRTKAIALVSILEVASLPPLQQRSSSVRLMKRWLVCVPCASRIHFAIVGAVWVLDHYVVGVRLKELSRVFKLSLRGMLLGRVKGMEVLVAVTL